MDFEALAQDAVGHRLQWAFGIPGGGPSLQLIDALMRRGVRFITTGHETTGALMAGAVARTSGTPAAAIAIKGPGLMNLAPGLLANAYEGYPMLSISEAYPSAVSSARRHKWLVHGPLLGAFGKAFACCDGAPDLVGRCWRRANAEFPGPVHLDLAPGPGPTSGDDASIADNPGVALTQVRAATRPAVIVGSLALRASWRERLSKLTVPVFTTVAAKGAIPEFSPYAAGAYTGDGKPVTPEKCVLPAADLVVAIGVRSGEVLNADFPHNRVLRLDTLAVRAGGVFPPQASDATLYLTDEGFVDILDGLGRKSWGVDECAAAWAGLEAALRQPAWSPALTYRAISAALPDAVHVLDTGNFTVVGEHVLRVSTEHHILGTPNGRYMGLGIGYALGAAVASPDRPVVLWIGDGGIRAFIGELSLAVEHKLKLLVLVMADGYFGSIRGRALAQGWVIDPLRMEGRDVRRIVDAMGMETLAVKDEASLARGLAAWRASAQPMLIRCDFDPEEYARVAERLR